MSSCCAGVPVVSACGADADRWVSDTKITRAAATPEAGPGLVVIDRRDLDRSAEFWENVLGYGSAWRAGLPE